MMTNPKRVWLAAAAKSMAVLSLGALTACGGEKQPDGAESKPGVPSDSVVTIPSVPTVTVSALAPNSFSGTLACADCSGVETTVAIFADSTYRLRQKYTGVTRPTAVTMGRWVSDGGTITLTGLTGTMKLAQVSEDTLRLLDTVIAGYDNKGGDVLVRADSMNALREPVTVVGAFSYEAGAATFRECGSGQTYPVLKKGGYADLERAYTSAKLPPGSAQQVELSGRFKPRPNDLEGPRERDVLEVVTYLGPSANPDCK